MSAEKKKVREAFRNATFKRDRYACVMCKKKPKVEELDAHHITPREEMPNGGYVKENGITLCADCHIKAEDYLQGRTAWLRYAPEDLYAAIKSNKELARAAAEKLGDDR